jgi:hypothetical protein
VRSRSHFSVGSLTTSAVTLAGMRVGSADGMPVNVAETPQNRTYFGTTGTADGPSPFAQLRVVAVTAPALPASCASPSYERQVRYGYPPEVTGNAERAASAMLAAVTSGTEPLG